MYKGLVLKIKKHYAIVLTKDNDYKKITAKDGLFIGQKIVFLEDDIMQTENIKTVNTMRKKVIALATTAAMVLIMILGSNFMPVSTYALISIDINPSLDIRIDKDQNVIEIIPLNDDADDIYGDHMIGNHVFDVIDEMISNAETLNYITEENNHILISSANLSKKQDETLSELITSHLENELMLHTNVQIIYIESNKETAKESLNQGVSLGRLEVSKLTNEDVKEEKVLEIAAKAQVKKNATHIKIKDMDDIDTLNDLVDELNGIENPSVEIIEFLESIENLEEEDLNKVIKDAVKILDTKNNLLNQVKDLAVELKALDTDDEEILNLIDEIDQLITDNQNSNRELAALKNRMMKILHDYKTKGNKLDDIVEELEEFREEDLSIDEFLDDYQDLLEDGANELDLRNEAKDHLLRIQKQEKEHRDKGKNELVKLIKYLNKLEAYRDDPKIAAFIDTTRETIKTDLSNIEEYLENAEEYLDDLEEKSNKGKGKSNQNSKGNPSIDESIYDELDMNYYDDDDDDEFDDDDDESDDDESDDDESDDNESDDDESDDDD